jgi:hypothetical protein
MEQMLSTLIDKPVASIFGVIAMVCIIMWPVFGVRQNMLLVYLGNDLAFAAHYALLDLWTASAMNVLLGLQTVAAIYLEKLPGSRWFYIALIPVVAGASLLTWQGLTSILAAAATMLSTVGKMQHNEVALKLIVLSQAPFWGLHDLMVGSLPGFIAAVANMATAIMVLMRTADRRASKSEMPFSPWTMISPSRMAALQGSLPAVSTTRR